MSDMKIFNRLIFIVFIFCAIFFIAKNPSLALGEGGVDIAVLNAGVGARPLGMGGAFSAIADNADAPYWNPAGLSKVQSMEITTMQTRLSSDTDHYYISYVAKLFKGTIGLSWVQVSLGQITETTTIDGFNEVIVKNVFSYFSNAYMLSYGVPITSNFSAGLTAKYLTSDMTQISGGQAYGYSVTPGILLDSIATPFSIFSFGAKIDDLFNEQKWGTGTVEKAVPKGRVGVAMDGLKILPKGSTLAVDISQPLKRDYSPSASVGYEIKDRDLSFRLGFSDSNLTSGIGIKSGAVILDYAYVQQSALSKSNVHRISLSGKW